MKIGIYGLGRFGSFWAGSLAEKLPQHEIYASSRNTAHAVPQGVIRCSLAELAACDTIILCVAISAMEAVARELGDRVSPGTLVMDTCSVKSYPVQIMLKYFPSSVPILATHPMFGPDSGRNGIQGLPLVFCPVRGESALFEVWKTIFSDIGLIVYEMTPEEHDFEAAYTQGITHFIGRVLDDIKLKPSKIATSGYKSLLNIVEQTCNDPVQLFHDLQVLNPYTRDMRSTLQRSLDKMLKQLE